jgi:ribose 5-phosphate isomerase B
MKVGIGCDTKGYRLKLHILRVLQENGYTVEDVGCHSLEKVDYPDYARLIGEGIVQGKWERGVLICGTGMGMSIAANKIPGVRAAVCYDMLPAILSREHNDANVFCTGGWIIEPEKAGRILLEWLEMRYAGGGHEDKLVKIRQIEADYKPLSRVEAGS